MGQVEAAVFRDASERTRLLGFRGYYNRNEPAGLQIKDATVSNKEAAV